MRFMFDRKEREDKKFPIYSGLAIFFISILLYIIIAAITGFIFDFQYFIWIVLYGLMLCLNNVYGYIVRGYGANSLYAFSGIIATTVTVACNLIFIFVLGWDYKALYISHCISMFVSVIILETKCKLIVNFSKKFFNKELFIKMLKFSLPLAINSVAFWLLTSANKLIVTMVLGAEHNGYLAIANKFTAVLYLVSSCIQLAWQELVYSRDNGLKQSTGEFYSKAFDLYLRILLVGLFLLIPLIKIGLAIYPNFIDVQYNDSIILIPLALAGTVMAILSSFLGSVFGGIKQNNFIFVSTLLGAIVNLGVIFALINIIGVMAANIAFCAGFTATVLMRTLILKRKINMKVKYWYFAIAIPLLIAIIYVFNLNWFYNLLTFAVIAALGGLVLKPELTVLYHKVKSRLKQGK
jgi:O-antigen/teichoic acid export membrane protein